MDRRVSSAVLVLVFSVFAAVGLASAQTIVLRGRVVDPQGAVVARASVRLSVAGAPRSAVTAPDGGFVFEGLSPGRYTITVRAAGFSAFSRSLDVVAGAEPLTLALSIDGLREAVGVEAVVPGAGTTRSGKPLRDLPLTVDTVPSRLIAEQGATTLVEALANVPGANAFTTYGVYEYYALRGFLDSVQLVDGVRNEGNRINTQLTGLQAIEVLKGASSALYGGGALGATVNLIRRQPSPTPSYEFVAGVGSWGERRAAFGAGGRLGATVAYRVDAGTDAAEGFRHTDTSRASITPAVTWRPASAGELRVAYTFNRDRFGGDAGLPLVDPDLGVPVAKNVLAVASDRNYRTPYDRATSVDHNLQAVYSRQLTANWGFRNTTAFRHFNDEYFLSEGLTFDAPRKILRDYLYFKHHRRPLTNRAEVTGRVVKGVEHELLVGWEGQRYANHTDLPEEDFFSAAPIDAFDPIETQGPSDLTIATSNVFTQTTHALYAQDHLRIAPRLSALVGGRFDAVRRQSRSDAIDGDATTRGAIAKREAEAFTGRAGLVYQPTARLDVYGSFATAFKPLTQAQPDGSTLEPETGAQMEAGQRLRLAGDRVRLQTSVYRILRQNVAFRRSGNVYVQAGEVRSRGFEAGFDAAVASRWRVNASYGFTDAAFLDYEETPGVNRRGNTPVFAPRHTVNVWTGYDWANGLGVNVGARYLGRTFADNANTFAVDGYGVANLAMRYRRGRVDYQVNVNNLTDAEYYTAHLDYLQVYPGNPVNAQAQVRVRFR